MKTIFMVQVTDDEMFEDENYELVFYDELEARKCLESQQSESYLWKITNNEEYELIAESE